MCASAGNDGETSFPRKSPATVSAGKIQTAQPDFALAHALILYGLAVPTATTQGS